MPSSLTLTVLEPRFAVVRLPAGAGLPWWAVSSNGFLSFTCTPSETSVVCEQERVPESVTAERDFRAFRVEGTLPFDAVGILASLASPLADAGVPVFVVSTFDTDYVLVRGTALGAAVSVLRGAGHSVVE